MTFQHTTTRADRRRPWALAVNGGLLAGAVSAFAMAWRGRVDTRAVCSGLNAPSHWLWGDVGLVQDGGSLRYTVVGLGVHQASSFLWSAVFALLRRRRRRPTAANALGDAAVVTAAAACVDLAVVPHRLTPGFQERLSTRSLGWIYGSFAASLALAGLLALAHAAPRVGARAPTHGRDRRAVRRG